MELILTNAWNALMAVGRTLEATWPYLAASIVVAAGMKAFVDEARIAGFLQRNRRGGVVAATAAAVGTPLCSCGTTAIVLGMMASVTPWAPIVAFMVASPLTSPQELFYSAALFGWPFALAFFGASITLGLAAGAVAIVLERRGWFAGQSRLTRPRVAAGETRPASMRLFASELVKTGRQLAAFFLSFAFLGYFLNAFIPEGLVASLFGSGRLHGVPLAATLGIPFYFNTEASLPLLRPMIDGGMSAGAALAFLITGAGTSVGAVAGALTIARWKVVALVVGTLWIGAVTFGFAFDAFQSLLV